MGITSASSTAIRMYTQLWLRYCLAKYMVPEVLACKTQVAEKLAGVCCGLGEFKGD